MSSAPFPSGRPRSSAPLCLLAPLALAALSAASCGPRTMQVRQRHAEELSDEVSSALVEARKSADVVEPTAMERALARAEEALGSPDIDLYPGTKMQRDELRELGARLPEVRKERERRDLEKRAAAAREKIGPRAATLERTLEGFSLAAATKRALESLEDQALDVVKRLDDEKDLSEKNKDFGQWARGQREKAQKALEAVAKGKRALAFLDGPVEAMRDGLELHKKALAKKVPADRVPALAKAKTQLTACEKDAGAASTDAALASVAFAMPGGKRTPAQVTRVCRAELVSVDRDLRAASAAAKKGARKRP